MLKEAGVDVTSATNDQKTKALAEAKEAYLATAFLSSSNRARFGKLLEELHNDHLKGNGKYPISLVGAHKLLVNWQHDTRNFNRPTAPNDGVAFATDGDRTSDGDVESEDNAALANDGRVVDRNGNEIKCFICGKNHYANRCPNQNQEDEGNKEKDV
eukprot:112577-Ditylum_brightwellii.AAC.1